MTYKTREEMVRMLRDNGHQITGDTYNQCTIDGNIVLRYGMRVHTLTSPHVKIYFDSMAIEKGSDLVVLWRGQHQVAEIPTPNN
jgi:hypothetical protein